MYHYYAKYYYLYYHYYHYYVVSQIIKSKKKLWAEGIEPSLYTQQDILKLLCLS